MTDAATRNFLRHSLATLRYRAAKVIDDAPEGMAAVRLHPESWTALQTLSHINDVLTWARSHVEGQERWHSEDPVDWDSECRRFHDVLDRLERGVSSTEELPCSAFRLFQGPIADSLTHLGQLATMRRQAGAPVKGENFYRADIGAAED